MKVLVLVAVWITLCAAQRGRRQGGFLDLTAPSQRCTTPLGEPGVCLNIKKCGSLLNLLQQRHRQEVVTYLRNSVCSFEDLEPVVCCSRISGDSILGSTTPYKATTEPVRPTNNAYTTQPSYQGPVNSLLPRTGECGISSRPNSRVVGGVNATLGEWPWVAALGYMSTKTPGKIIYLCGGSIITNYHILTAAHCVYKKQVVTVRVGDLNLYDDLDGASPVEIPIAQKIIHGGYNPTTFVNDIAILRLSRPIRYTKLVQPVCLPLADDLRNNNYLGSRPFVAGWGTTSFNGPSSNTMQYIQIPVVRESECKRAFSTFKTAVIDQRVLCAGYLSGGKDACKGDSGGPLMANEFTEGSGKFYQIGVVSYGYKCAEPGFPGVYTRVTEFLDWILDNLK